LQKPGPNLLTIEDLGLVTGLTLIRGFESPNDRTILIDKADFYMGVANVQYDCVFK